MTSTDLLNLADYHPFFNFINQVALLSEESDLYLVSLMTTLTVPDICGALESDDGHATGKKYMEWFKKWMAFKYQANGRPTLDGKNCYSLRCAALHQGRLNHKNLNFNGVIFFKPGVTDGSFHNHILNSYLHIDVQKFAHDMVNSATDWFEIVKGTEPFESNFEESMQIRKNGFGGIYGASVIA
ncbi:hypothetical protein [Xanthomonas arboricola]|uniref:hypothetical protein n=1 Tax=Xanthomonas arboricola TaxID=56448 RepID=UPI00129065B8|nr:hypothetical protein [Xanthomonas arboricola]